MNYNRFLCFFNVQQQIYKNFESQKGFEKKLQKIVISKTAKKEMRDKLNVIGINKDKLYRPYDDMQIKGIVDEMKIILELHQR